MFQLIIAAGFSVAAIATVYQSWRARAPAVFYLSLVLLLISCVLWSYSQGWEYGLVYALCLPGLLVWPFISANQVQLPPPKNIPKARDISVSVKSTFYHISNYLVVLVVLMLTSLLASLAICRQLPFAEAGQLATSVVLLPLIWGLLGYHYLACESKPKALIVYVVIASASAAALIFIPG
ncbi:hypothetical protein [Lacimicrobium alkaliphilum]|uniref:Cytochrome c assembly protein domain-containing protein n=1 Tax=Lacimicrobium alkaliphilum TaxID=1526571 RepID=A0ABQ1R119_9ALTE|nr:hypothetical protein [Lacimicrobium alkaliphilum]GGD51334.1 hypothetical protein GCM10011357_04040 [Lacimicrobium alkaliphilum]